MTIPQAIYWLGLVAAVAGPVLTFLWARKRLGAGQPRRAWTGAVLVAAAWSLGVWSCFIEPEQLVVREVEVATPLWTSAPVRLGLISDTHVGAPHMSPERMARVVERMNAAHPDLVLILGDYSGRWEAPALQAQPRKSVVLRGIAAFKALKAPLGVAAVFGNHDVDYGEASIGQALASAQVKVLENAAVRIDRPGGAFWLAGMADAISAAKPRPIRTYLGIPADEPSILMGHEPGTFARTERLPYALMVAGHTHCGQINLPLAGGLSLGLLTKNDRRFPCHLYAQGDQRLYVTGGLGVSNLPLRFRAPPEIVILTLRAAPALASEPPTK